MRALVFGMVVFVLVCRVSPAEVVGGEPEIVSVTKIWDRAPHNAFTDLVRFQDKWYCTFREADNHAGGEDGKIRVIVSAGGDRWESAALLTEDGVDLRDPKLSVMPEATLMLVAGGSLYDDGKYRTRAPRVAFSRDGRTWTPTKKILAEDHWLWRVTWHKGRAYALSKMGEGSNPRRGFLYSSVDGIDWRWITEFKLPGVSETTLRVMPDEEMIALVRPGYIGTSKPPYREWTFHEMKHKIGGPNFIRIPEGGLWASGRRYHPDGKRTTVLARMTRDGYHPVLTLPSGGDTSYPGMVWHDGLLWMSYYSSHEGKTSIYLAKIRFGKPRPKKHVEHP
jgi:hypothetical protein